MNENEHKTDRRRDSGGDHVLSFFRLQYRTGPGTHSLSRLADTLILNLKTRPKRGYAPYFGRFYHY
jgi:hypothetical protein